MKVPFYTMNSYNPIMEKSYSENDTSDWVDLKTVIEMMTEDFVSNLANLDARQLGNTNLDASKKDKIIACKLLLPTLWTCDYFFWNIGKGTHHGIDILVPRGTPITAFVDGEISRIKQWDGVTKNEGNCVVVKGIVDGNTIYFGYEHMDSISVSAGQKVKAGDIIGYVGTTGNSTKWHLHLQTDVEAKFHPFYSNARSISEIQTYTLNPIEILKKVFGIGGGNGGNVISEPAPVEDKPEIVVSNDVPAATTNVNMISAEAEKVIEPIKIETNTVVSDNLVSGTSNNIVDMPINNDYKNAIMKLFDMGIIKGSGGHVYPDNNISRYEFGLLIYRLIKKLGIESKLPNDGQINNFTDIDFDDPEFNQALEYLQKAKIMKGKGDKFNPKGNLVGEELLAILGRMFFNLSDSSDGNWYQNYYDTFAIKQIIPSGWAYIGKNTPRKEVFLLVSKCI